MQSTTDRRQMILEHLLDNRHATRKELAEKFGVSTRTIERDVIVLSCSYPIDTKKGTGGCVYVQDGFDLYERYLTAKQFELLERLKENLTGEDEKVLETILKSFGRNGGVKK